jgi:hypothetical protein
MTIPIQTKEQALAWVLGDLVAEAAADAPPVLTFDAIRKKADELVLLELITGYTYAAEKSLGHSIKRMVGRQLMDSKARGYVLGLEPAGRRWVGIHPRRAGGPRWVYPVTFKPMPHERDP